jgi:precorrin-6B methylase 2
MQALEKIKSAFGQLLGGSRQESSGKSPPRASLAYRKNKEAIRQGEIPKKYTRVLDVVPGERIIELGAAEGVLSLLLAERKQKVYALELRPERHQEALCLQSLWQKQGRKVDNCEMVLGDIRDRLDLLADVDTLVAVRSIYYLRDQVEDVFAEVGKHVPNVVLCGNGNRARSYFAANGHPDDNLGRFNFYASAEGMTQVLQGAGYKVTRTIPEGDAIVIGIKEIP